MQIFEVKSDCDKYLNKNTGLIFNQITLFGTSFIMFATLFGTSLMAFSTLFGCKGTKKFAHTQASSDFSLFSV